jgi:hypothetical protein
MDVYETERGYVEELMMDLATILDFELIFTILLLIFSQISGVI